MTTPRGIFLDKTTRKIEVVTAVPAATAPKVIGCCYDVPDQEKTDAAEYKGTTYLITSTGATPITLIPAPQRNGTITNVTGIQFVNSDSGALVITIQIDEGGTKYPLFSQSVAAGKTVCYERDSGWAIV